MGSWTRARADHDTTVVVHPPGGGSADARGGPDRSDGTRKSIDDLALALAEYVDWFERRPLLGEIGLMAPAEYEDTLCHHRTAAATAGAALPRFP